MLELGSLHVLHRLKLQLWDKIFVHVQKDVFDHDDAELDIGPNAVEALQKVVVVGCRYLLRDWLEDFDCCRFDVVVEHLSVLMEH